MAPSSPFPEIPMDQVQANEVKKAYHLMFKHIAKEFVHWEDLKIILQNGNLLINTSVNGGAVSTQNGPQPVIMAQGRQVFTRFTYQANARGLGLISQHEAEAIGLQYSQEAVISSVESALT